MFLHFNVKIWTIWNVIFTQNELCPNLCCYGEYFLLSITNFSFIEEILKIPCDTLKMTNSKEDGSNKMTTLCNQMLECLTTTNGHATKNIKV
jgi:hypothetical protein